MLKNNSHKLLLIQLFGRLRKELSLPLGIGEYQLLMEALEKGEGLQNGESLLKLCEALWIKSKDDRDTLRELLSELIKEEIEKIDEIARKEAEAARRKREEEARRKREEEERRRQEANPKPEDNNDSTEDEITNPKDEIAEDPTKKPEPKTKKSSQVRTKEEEEVGVVMDLPIEGENENTKIEESDNFILTDSHLPLTIREMKQIWRMLRHFAKGGASEDINIQATVKAIAKEGIVINPVFQSDRINKIRLIMLIDHAGSMVAFHSLTRDLVESAKYGGGHSNAEVFYFKECPVDYVFTSANHLNHKFLSSIYTKTSETYTVVMIVSDAGAAKGEFSPERIAQTKTFLEELKKHVARVSWFNPMPRNRWKSTSAYLIADMVPMFELMGESKQSHIREKNDPQKGMKQVINILQGKGT